MTPSSRGRKQAEPRGQILVITAVALVVLLGIAALVVDIGFGVILRRHEQNAVDPGAVAAARFINDDQSWDEASAKEAACHYARQNDFFPGATDDGTGVSGCVPANDPHGAVLEVHYPPDARAGQFQGHLGFVQVVLTRHLDTFLGQILGVASLSVQTDAVAARQRGETNTHSLISLAPTGCSTGHIHGTGDVEIYPAFGYTGPGGYVQVNSDCDSGSGDDVCGPGGGALKIDGTADLSAPKVNVHGSCQNKQPVPPTILDEAAVQIGDPLEGLIPPQIDTSQDGARCGAGGLPTRATGPQSNGCGNNPMSWFGSPAANCPGMTSGYTCVELSPGVYYGGWDLKGDKIHLKLAPGIYIIAGGGVKLTTDSISSVAAAGGQPAPILIFNTDNPAANCPGSNSGCQQDLTLGTANSTLKIRGLLADQPCPPVTIVGGCPFGGMVIWYDAGGSQLLGLVNVEGGGSLYISGTIYAPKAHVKIEGHAGTNCGTGNETQLASVQIIAWTWDIGGTGDLCMPYDPTKLYKLSLQGLVH